MTPRRRFGLAAAGLVIVALLLMVTGFGLFGLVVLAVAAGVAAPALRQG